MAICTRTKVQLKSFQDEFSIPFAFTDYSEMLASPEIAAVVIATGTSAHKEQPIVTLEAGKHAFYEKPLVLTLEECREIEAPQAGGLGGRTPQ